MNLALLGHVSVIKIIQNLITVKYADVAASAMFIYDYALTMQLEIDLLWTSDWNVVKVIYLIQRYTPFVDTVSLLLYRSFAQLELTSTSCERLTYAYAVINILGMLACEALLAICIWALWAKTKRVAILLFVAFIGLWTPSCAFMYFFVKSLQFVDTVTIMEVYSGYRGCFVISRNRDLTWVWVGLAVWDALALVLVGLPAIQSYRTGLHSVSAFSSMIYRDGAMYYVFLFIMSIINIVTNVVLAPDLRIITTAMTRCIHSMLASRVLLHIREHGNKDTNVTLGTIRSALIFTNSEAVPSGV